MTCLLQLRCLRMNLIFVGWCLRNNKKESELTTAVGHWRNLEAALNSKEADYANLLASNRRLESEISELRSHVTNVSPEQTPHLKGFIQRLHVLALHSITSGQDMLPSNESS